VLNELAPVCLAEQDFCVHFFQLAAEGSSQVCLAYLSYFKYLFHLFFYDEGYFNYVYNLHTIIECWSRIMKQNLVSCTQMFTLVLM